jgi:hypothetical protein
LEIGKKFLNIGEEIFPYFYRGKLFWEEKEYTKPKNIG